MATEYFVKLWDNNIIQLGIWQTVYMTALTTIFAYLIGLPLGVILWATDKDGLHPNKGVNTVLGFIVNFFRSIPEKSLKHRLLIGRSGFRKFFLFHETDPLRLFLLPAMNLHIILLGPVKDQRKQVRKTHGAAIDCPCFGAVHLLRRIINHPAELRTTPKNQG